MIIPWITSINAKSWPRQGGAYTNKNNIYVDIKVDNSLCDNLYFSADGDKVLPMPSNYYSLSSEQIVIPSGKPSGGIEVQLTDAFFLLIPWQ
ncbi:MAG: DUF1735 domain-containing protein [Tannerellaceae bacterium]|nr:DUF1735 domain-containing protein [Tannerellaceae bacterium]